MLYPFEIYFVYLEYINTDFVFLLCDEKSNFNMASLKIVIRTNKKKVDGTCPLALRIIKDRKTRFVFTGQYILEKDWDAEGKEKGYSYLW